MSGGSRNRPTVQRRASQRMDLASSHQVLDEAPDALTKRPLCAAFLFTCGEVLLSAVMLAASARLNLGFRPVAMPFDLSSPDPIVRPAGLLPIAHRRTQTWAVVGVFKPPFSGPLAACGFSPHTRMRTGVPPPQIPPKRTARRGRGPSACNEHAPGATAQSSPSDAILRSRMSKSRLLPWTSST